MTKKEAMKALEACLLGPKVRETARSKRQTGPNEKDPVKKLFDQLLERLLSDDDDVCLAALAFLNKFGLPDVIHMVRRALVNRLSQKNAAKQGRAAQVLVALMLVDQDRDPAALVPGRVLALKDAAPEVRRDAAKALGALKGHGKKALPALTALLSDPDYSVQVAAADAIGCIEGDDSAEEIKVERSHGAPRTCPAWKSA